MNRKRIYKRDGFLCAYCGQSVTHWPRIKGITRPAWAASIDHRVPKSLGGTDDDENLVTCCYGCNYAKGILTDDEFREHIAEAANSVSLANAEPSS